MADIRIAVNSVSYQHRTMAGECYAKAPHPNIPSGSYQSNRSWTDPRNTHEAHRPAECAFVALAGRFSESGDGYGYGIHRTEGRATYYLVTNWHVVTARRPDTGAPLDPQGRTPDQLRILHNAKGRLGEWVLESEPLFDASGKPRWFEHNLGRAVDVVCLPLSKLENAELYATDLSLQKTPIRLLPAGEVSIIGFPFGHASFLGLPIWKAGSLASDPEIDYDNTPQILVDTTARPGMSGAPVYARRVGGFLDEEGNYNIVRGTADRFVGVFAGAIDQFSEVGRIWKASALIEIYDKLK